MSIDQLQYVVQAGQKVIGMTKDKAIKVEQNHNRNQT